MLLNCRAEKTLKSPLDYKEIKQVNPKGNQPWIFIGRTAAEAEAPILWPPDVNSQLIGRVGKELLMLVKTESKRRRERQRMKWLGSIVEPMDMNLSKLQEIRIDEGAWCASVHAVTKSWTRLSDWTKTTNYP